MDDNQTAIAVLVPIFGSLIIFGGPMAAFIVFRILAHRERMEMIRHGIVPPGRKFRGYAPGPTSYGPIPGPMNVPPGAMMPGAMMPPDYESQMAAQQTLRKGISVAFVGMALTIGLSLIGFRHGGPGGFVLGPWLLGGLVPLFVGLAQIVTALISGATLGNLAPPRQGAPWHAAQPGYADPFAPGPPGAPGAPQQTAYEERYAYRPGDTQELRRPMPPPERKS
jgi:hypothetical protein